MRIVVAGATGLLGSALVPYLTAVGHDVITIGRRTPAHVLVDLSDAQALSQVLDAAKADALVNLVAMTNVDACEQAPQTAFKVNAEIVQRIVDALKAVSSSVFFVHISTDQVYSGQGPHQEDRVAPINYYAYSKLLGEKFAETVPSCVLRTNFFGQSRCSTRESLSDWVVGVLRRQEPAAVFSDIVFSPLSMQTLVELVCRCIERKNTGVFNLGSRGGASKADFAYGIARHLGMSPQHLSRLPSPARQGRAQRPKDMRMDSSRFERVFGMTLPTFEEELALVEDIYA